jgi:hypothetical protein
VVLSVELKADSSIREHQQARLKIDKNTSSAFLEAPFILSLGLDADNYEARILYLSRDLQDSFYKAEGCMQPTCHLEFSSKYSLLSLVVVLARTNNKVPRIHHVGDRHYDRRSGDEKARCGIHGIR